MSETVQQHQLQAVRNQVLFRDVNERIEELQAAWIPLTEIDFLCECANETCSAPISASRAEYDTVRASPLRFLVRPDHVYPATETVVERNERFWVIEKLEQASQIARQTAPARKQPAQ